MIPFEGFPAGKTRFTPIPDLFFAGLLPAIDDLAELKVTLFMFWFLHRQRGYPRYMTQVELGAERVLLAALRETGDEDPVVILQQAVDRAVERGTLLRLTIEGEDGADVDYLFVNTPQGRRAVEAVRSGELELEVTGPVREPHVEGIRPTIFELYEQNVGLLQPLLAEELRDAADTYPESWITDAFRIAAESNVRSWRYIKSILERWAHEGRQDDRPRRSGARRSL
jgi:DnaD/phage-associated family protein